ncbi:MAG: hypothetical protein Q8O95_05150 [bacterium]|nr:hypothetical protein [bacterium]
MLRGDLITQLRKKMDSLPDFPRDVREMIEKNLPEADDQLILDLISEVESYEKRLVEGAKKITGQLKALETEGLRLLKEAKRQETREKISKIKNAIQKTK